MFSLQVGCPVAGESSRGESSSGELSSGPYSWVGTSASGQKKLAAFVAACDAAWPHIAGPPVTTCQDYMDRVSAILAAVQELKRLAPPVFLNDYGGPRPELHTVDIILVIDGWGIVS